MTIAKPRTFTLPNPASLFEAAIALFRSPDRIAQPQSRPVMQKPSSEPVLDRDRYARLLEHELDQQHLTAVERDDSEMLDRVRSALYRD